MNVVTPIASDAPKAGSAQKMGAFVWDDPLLLEEQLTEARHAVAPPDARAAGAD